MNEVQINIDDIMKNYQQIVADLTQQLVVEKSKNDSLARELEKVSQVND